MGSTARQLTAAVSLLGLISSTLGSAQEAGPPRQSITEDAGSALAVAGLLDVTTSDALSPEFIRSVAHVGNPAEVTLDTKQTVRNIIEARCGIVSPTYVEEFLSQNGVDNPSLSGPDLEKPQPGRKFVFPFCVRPGTIQAPMTRTIGDLYQQLNLTLDLKAIELARKTGSIAARPLNTLRLFGSTTGVGSNSGFVSTELSRKFLRDNPTIDPRSTQPGTLLLATTPEVVATVPLRSGLGPSDAKATFTRNGARGTIDAARVANLIGDEALLPGECQGVIKDQWPFPAAALANELARVRNLHPADISRPREVKVMTVDTGYDPALGMPAIDSNLFGYLRGAGSADLTDRIGLNANDEELLDANPPDGLSQRQHGGEVAATLLGGRYLQRTPPVFTSPKIAFVSIAAINAAGTPYLDVGGINEAMVIARRSDVRILNASVSAIARRESFRKLIAGDEERLIIAAAGNSRSHPAFDDGDLPWPGSLGGERGNASSAVVISVGAHDPSGDILQFSRYGPQVDILAPGCRIPTYTLKDGRVEEVERSGTSFAAPLVSLVASQLAMEGLTPSQIKERLFLSADVDERIVRKSYSGGRLDAVRALSLWHDVVTYEKPVGDGSTVSTTVSGKLESNFATIDICGQSIEHAKLLKLALSRMPGPTPVAGNWRGWATVQGVLQRTDVCREGAGAVSGPEMRIKRDDGEIEVINVASIRSFTARFR